ncbi:hypothetical protein PGT21_015824 [Puccinia graminis f. sp. tritici]|uniref:Ribosome assembly protein 3 n=1 Tax=Puccinia graminis f. sp. tritici TaxID=56615 RepID=A0A5B0M2H7_PUCGR|nr:hypothetical protein PGT21_015824 [Puccinia graminis f. sp. tritici]KAA1089852.1 hypothetical protein PGTUg99_023583 [Puccinia graminis f. sp. tritici]
MPPRPRKRVRRRRVSEKFDDSSDSSSSSSDSGQSTPKNPNSVNKPSSDSDGSSSESESTDSSSSSSSSSGSSINRPTAKRGRLAKKQNLQARALQPQDGGDPTNPQTMRRSPSPVEQSPPPPLPSSFFDPDLALPYLDSSPDFSLPAGFESKPTTRQVDGLLQSTRQQLEQDEERFRAWYMATIVDRFPNELDLLRSSDNNPQKTQSNLDLLVAALGSGVDIFDENIILSSTSSSSTTVAANKLALDDHQLVLQSLDLAKQTLHLDPSICPQPLASPQSHEDVEMSDGADS